MRRKNQNLFEFSFWDLNTQNNTSSIDRKIELRHMPNGSSSWNTSDQVTTGDNIFNYFRNDGNNRYYLFKSDSDGYGCIFGYTVDRVRIFNKHMLNNYTEGGTSILNFDSNFNYTSVVNFPSMSQIKYPYFDRNSNKIFIGFYLEDDMCINNSLYNGLNY